MKYSMYKGLMSTLHIFLLWIHICTAQSSSIVVFYLRLVFCVLIYNTREERERGIFMNKWLYFFLRLIVKVVHMGNLKKIIKIWWWLTGNVKHKSLSCHLPTSTNPTQILFAWNIIQRLWQTILLFWTVCVVLNDTISLWTRVQPLP